MEAQKQAQSGQYLTFLLKGQSYGVAIATIREINRVTDITPVPQTAHYFAGVMNLRGKVIPVMDLRLKLGFESTAHTKETCIIVIECGQDQIGMIVDSVSGVIDLTDSQIEATPNFGGDNDQGNYVMGMGKLDNQVIILLDIVECLSTDGSLDMEAYKKAAA